LSLLRGMVAPLFRHPTRVDPSVIAALAGEARPRAFALASAQAGALDLDIARRTVTAPVRAVHGDRDVFVAASDNARLAALLPDFTSTTVADSGHFGHIEQPYARFSALFDR
jgi:pimeloyl-ACP methyl ester carboxylesterase